MPAWRRCFKRNKELVLAWESCLPAALWAAAFPEAKSVCNAWSDTHWQPAQTFPASRGSRGKGRFPNLSHLSISDLALFQIKTLNLEVREKERPKTKRQVSCWHSFLTDTCSAASFFSLSMHHFSVEKGKAVWTFVKSCRLQMDVQVETNYFCFVIFTEWRLLGQTWQMHACKCAHGGNGRLPCVWSLIIL